MKPLFVTFGVVTVIFVLFVCYALGMHKIEGNWSVTGQIGDTFGVVNAFVSTLALYGVIRAFRMQQEQLKEMRRATQVQVSPVMMLREYKPHLYFYGGEKGIFPFPSIDVAIEICNNSESPIVNLDGAITIVLPGKEKIVFMNDSFMWPIIEGNGGTTGYQHCLARNGDVEQLVCFLRSMVGDSAANPILTCHFKYRNILGAAYEYKQMCRLQVWHEEKDAKKELSMICSQLLAPEQHLGRLLEIIKSKTDKSDFYPAFHKCVEEWTCGVISTNKIDNYEISMIAQQGDLIFRAISDKEYEALDFKL